jgi:hypothetical protein
MFQLFVSRPSFEDWSEDPSDWSLSELLAELTVAGSLAALALTLIRALAMLLWGELLADGSGPPPSLHLALLM